MTQLPPQGNAEYARRVRRAKIAIELYLIVGGLVALAVWAISQRGSAAYGTVLLLAAISSFQPGSALLRGRTGKGIRMPIAGLAMIVFSTAMLSSGLGLVVGHSAPWGTIFKWVYEGLVLASIGLYVLAYRRGEWGRSRG